MHNEFDKILANKIKETFENQNVTYNPEHWKMLLAKKNSKKKRIAIFWRVAAILVVGILVGSYFHFYKTHKNSSKPTFSSDVKVDSVKIDSLPSNSQQYITSKSTIDTTKIHFLAKKKDTAHLNKNITFNHHTTHQIKLNNKNYTITTNQAIDSNKILNSTLKINTENNNLISLNNNKVIVVQDSAVLNNNFLALINNQHNSEIEKESNSKSKIKIGVGVAPFLNAASVNENSTVGVISGISVDYALSNTFEISSGIYYSNQKFDLNQSTNYLTDAVSFSNASQLVEKNATLEGIEIPLNLKYNFLVNKNVAFVALGFSSTSSFNQKIESKYIINTTTRVQTKDALGNNITKYELYTVDKSISSPNSSNTFNFANVLNASFGISFPTKNSQSFIVEPYLKYYLKPISNQNADVIGAGIQLRYIFSIQKK
jgi:cytoskeletal protein RodZ